MWGHFDAKYAIKYAEFGEICAEICGKNAKCAVFMRSHVEMCEDMQIFAYVA